MAGGVHGGWGGGDAGVAHGVRQRLIAAGVDRLAAIWPCSERSDGDSSIGIVGKLYRRCRRASKTFV
jgi:hypothetical protein